MSGMGQRIKVALGRKGMNQRELSDKTNITEATISRYIAGSRTPTVDMAVIIAKALEVSIGWLILGDEEHCFINIKTCPFCGEAATTFHIPENDKEEMKAHPQWRWRYPGMWVIGCDTENCIGNVNHFSMLFMKEEDAAAAWNRRAYEKD